MPAFTLPNVLFSFAVGAVLLVLGAYGRISGSLPAHSPYASDAPEPVVVSQAPRNAADIVAVVELADAWQDSARGRP
jgi:hypothetical protein